MKVQLSGRLGNQLFEIAHGFGRAESSAQTPEFIWDIYSYPDGISKEVSEISGIYLRRNDAYGSLFRFLDKLRSYSELVEKALCRVLRIEREHNQNSFCRPIAISGYFQDFTWAEKNYLKMREIYKSCPDVENFSSSQVGIPSTYQAFHYRCGDYLNHPANFGVLSREYYLRNMNPDLPVVIVTDSLDKAKETFKGIGNALYIDPKNSSAWQAISIISASSHVVSSNSTLSWWGSFFAVKSGGTAVMPVPFFANGNPVKLYHPDFTLAQATFD